jgi:hypothetical protein
VKRYKPRDILKLVDEFVNSNNYSMLLTFEDGEVINMRSLMNNVKPYMPSEYIYCCCRYDKKMIWFEKLDWKEDKND